MQTEQDMREIKDTPSRRWFNVCKIEIIIQKKLTTCLRQPEVQFVDLWQRFPAIINIFYGSFFKNGPIA